MTTAERVALNVERKYGTDGLILLVGSLKAGRSQREIALAFDVSKQRVFQWAIKLGMRTQTYHIHEGMLQIAQEEE